jgi:nucleotide-binding universal stress UspA family protein
MMPFRRILFPVDFSEATLAMVPYVTEMAQRFNATVTVLNAFNLIPDYIADPRIEGTYASEPIPIPYTLDLQELRKQRERRLDDFSHTQFSSVSQTARIEDGDPAMVIEWVAQRENTDLIMMPSKGLGRFRRFLFGSVTAKVLHDLSCPVFTSAHEPAPALASLHGYRSIICAVELDREADAVLKAAGLLAQAHGARICLLNIESSCDRPDGGPYSQSVAYAFEKAISAGGREIDVDTTVRVVDAEIPAGIRRTAIEEKADLIVVGRGHQKGNLSRMWSHLYAIIRESPCPVLSV